MCQKGSGDNSQFLAILAVGTSEAVRMRKLIKVEYLLHIEIQLKAFIKRCENVGFIYRKNMAGQPAFLYFLIFYQFC